MIPALKVGVLTSMGFAVVTLIWLTIRTRNFRNDPRYAQARGSRLSGILYAFGPAMMPWRKESARNHLATYLLGIVYHVGVFAGWTTLVIHLADGTPAPFITSTVVWLMIAGAVAGMVLLIKRLANAAIRSISCPDDVASNLIVDLFLVTGILVSFSVVSPTWWYVIAIALFLYMPLGKIRHCAFFFTTRILYGIFFGRRGVFPVRAFESGKRMET